MPRHRSTALLRRPRAVGWVLLVALLFALSPALNQPLAYAGLDGAQAMDICSSQGPQNLAAAGAHAAARPAGPQPTPTPTSAPAPPHCPMCLQPADRHAPPAAPRPPLLTLQAAQRQPPHRQPFFYLDAAPLWAPARGPPAAIGI